MTGPVRAFGPRAAAELLAVLVAAADANRRAELLLRRGCASCGHSDVAHDLDRHGRRTRCSTSTGPRATPCDCPTFTPILDTDQEHTR